ncbi:MAG: anti-sigma factor family protein [Rhodospirillales bacterium]
MPEIRSIICVHVEGDLPRRKQRAVDEHMAVCEACRDFAARLETSQSAVKDQRSEAVDVEALEEIRRRVLARIAAEAPAPRFSWKPAYAAAAVLAVIAVVWISRREPVPPPPLPFPAASVPAPEPALRRASHKPSPARKPRVRPPVDIPRPEPKPSPEPLLVKLETSDPNVVIYWIIESGE